MDKYEKRLRWLKENGRKPTGDEIFGMIGDASMHTPGDKPICTTELLFYTEQTLSGHVVVRMARVILPGNCPGTIKPTKIKRLRVGGPSPFRCPKGYFSIPGDFRAIGHWSYQRDLENMPPVEPEPDPLTELLKRKDVRKRLNP
jgi:hypothetical protein